MAGRHPLAPRLPLLLLLRLLVLMPLLLVDTARAQCQTVCDPGQLASENGDGDIVCTDCDVGKYNAKGGRMKTGDATGGVDNICKDCPVGQTSPAGASACGFCPSGKKYDTMFRACVDCPAGRWSNLIKVYDADIDPCNRCPVATEVKSSNPNGCENCPEGEMTGRKTWDTDDTDDHAACFACPAGRFADMGGYTPMTFTGGAAGANTPTCRGCVFGQFQNDEGQTECKKCQAGQVSFDERTNKTKSPDNPVSAVRCIACEIGRYAAVAAMAGMPVDPAGGAGMPVDSAGGAGMPGGGGGDPTQTEEKEEPPPCLGCAQNRYADVEGLSICKSCGNGKYSLGPTSVSAKGAESCIECPEGQHMPAAGIFTECQPCDAGFYQDQTGQTQCKACETGKISGQPDPENVSTFPKICTSCPAGSFDSGMHDRCSVCPRGYAQIQNGEANCDECSAGKFSERGGLTVCQSCDKGKYNPTQGARTKDSCKLCD